MAQRRNELDFLKTVGLLCIILAHVNRPPFLFQLRNFDVPMMVLISGILAQISWERTAVPIRPGQYITKRFIRLVVPTWIFLTFYFLYLYIKQALPEPVIILNTFLLAESGIGFVWIVSVYMICAALTPFVRYVDLNKGSHAFALAMIYICYELLFRSGHGLPNLILNNLFYYIVPYGSVLILGFNYDRLSAKKKNGIMLASLCIYGILAIHLMMKNGGYVQTNAWKYPARLYYLSYAIAISFFLLNICTSHPQCPLFRLRYIRFLSSSSFWIYLWHILLLNMVHTRNWFTHFLLVLAGSSLIVYLQNRLVDFAEKTWGHKEILSIFRG